MRAYYSMLYKATRGERATTIRRLYGEDFMVDETLWEGEVLDGHVFGCDGKSGKGKNRVLHVFTFRDGKIAFEQAWLDLGAIQQYVGASIG